jgi:hypothetical protein
VKAKKRFRCVGWVVDRSPFIIKIKCFQVLRRTGRTELVTFHRIDKSDTVVAVFKIPKIIPYEETIRHE